MTESKKTVSSKNENKMIMKLTDSQKFEAIKYRHENQSNLLQLMSGIDLKVFISFLTLQLLLAGFIAQTDIANFAKIGLTLVDLSLSFVCVNLLYNNYRRRKEIVETLKNCNDALGYEFPDIFLQGKKINATTVFRPWFSLYLVGIALSVMGIFFILMSNPALKDKELVGKAKTENIGDLSLKKNK